MPDCNTVTLLQAMLEGAGNVAGAVVLIVVILTFDYARLRLRMKEREQNPEN